ncbi:DUF1800 domain-containing protein [Roseateles paludis]|uniref:DUF1800 family protein n=1 Tax=Roseateles paludis TaxID=3145238 RepID=A0ABV0G0K4_9BURK
MPPGPRLTHRLAPALALALGVLLTACGGGGGGSSGGGSTPGPSPEPSLPALAPLSDRDAVRLADQASFGATEALVASLKSQSAVAWVQAQMALPASRYSDGGDDRVHVNTDGFICDDPGAPVQCWRDYYSAEPLVRDFYRNALGGSDQLRQRVALALQQILVVSDREVSGTYGLRRYQQLFLDLAFDNYREVLRRVALSPVMGDYLDHANNDPTAPNENFARELLQLFSLGTCLLQPDGSLQTGTCQPTYDNATVRAYAYALTGWTYPAGGSTRWGCWPQGSNCTYYGGDMVALPARHDKEARSLLSGRNKAASSTPVQALDTVLDSLMEHPNMAPFIGRQMIQALVTSNPSPAYVERVALAFSTGSFVANGRSFGQRQRGDLAATVAAVLLDAEARGDTPPANAGRLREPVLFMTGTLRLLDGRSDGDAMGYWWGEQLNQHLFHAPSVFNFYPPDYPVPGTTLVGPAFGIHNANTALARLNFLSFFIDQGGAQPNPELANAIGTKLSLAGWTARADDGAKLLDQMSMTLLGRALPEASRSAVQDAVNAWTDKTNPNDWRERRVRTAALLLLASPQYQVPR